MFAGTKVLKEAASIDQNIEPFARFLADRVHWSMEQAA